MLSRKHSNYRFLQTEQAIRNILLSFQISIQPPIEHYLLLAVHCCYRRYCCCCYCCCCCSFFL